MRFYFNALIFIQFDYELFYFQTSEGDEPPFNFQGMLRKTKHNRNSMKRSTEAKLSLADSNNNNSEAFVETSESFSTVVYHSKLSKQVADAIRRNSSRNSNHDDNHNFIQEEIAPGLNENKISQLVHSLFLNF